MAFQRNTDESLRENILRHMVERLSAMRVGQDGSSVTWEKVHRAPLPEQAKIGKSALSVLDIKETKKAEIGATRCTLVVSIEFVIRVQLGAEPSPILNRLLSDIQRVMTRDPQCRYLDASNTSRQLAIDVSEVRSELDIEGPGDRLVGGVVFWAVDYRHRPDDPSKFRGE